MRGKANKKGNDSSVDKWKIEGKRHNSIATGKLLFMRYISSGIEVKDVD